MNSNQDIEKTWYVLQSVCDADLINVAKFLDEEYGNVDIGPRWSTELLRWKAGSQNPAGSGIIFFACLNGKVVGSVSLVLKRFLLKGQQCLMAEIGDAYTSKTLFNKPSKKKYKCSTYYSGLYPSSDYINNAIFGRLAAETVDWAAQAGVYAIYGTPNAVALPSWLNKLNFKLVNKVEHQVRSRVLLTAELLASRIPLPKAVMRLLGRLINLIISLFLFFPLLKLSKFKISKITDFAATEFDNLWNNIIQENTSSLMRNKDWVKWRYQLNPDAKYEIYTLHSEENLCGWVVLKISCNASKPTIMICDWLFKTDPKLFVAFMFKVLQSAKFQGAVVKLWASDNAALTNNMWCLFALKGAPVKIVFKPLRTDENLNSYTEVFDDFTVGHSDNV